MAGKKTGGSRAALAQMLPEPEFMEFVFAWAKFVRVRRRLPSRRRMMFRTKMSPEIPHPLPICSTGREYVKKLAKAEFLR
ncbi:MAG: hypothetical protein CSA74_09180 [Rhodobacterales bacterium]|nr:MAG: hypothetical protein CSA74_09180 [Rhodobacterales bacterium]